LLLPIIRIERVRPRREHDPGPDLVIGRQSRQNSLPSGSAITMKPAATLLLKRPPSAPRPAAWRRPDVEVDATLGDLALGDLDEVEPRLAVAHGGIRVSRLGFLNHRQPGYLPPESGLR
jgi:hypothetical protein